MTTEDPLLAVRQLLIDDAAVSTIVSSRVYPQTAPGRAALPYVLLTPISIEADHHLGGSNGLWRATIQVDGYAKGYVAMRELSRAVVRALHGRPNPTYVTVPDPTGANPDEVFTLQLLRQDADNTSLFQPTDGSDEAIRRFSHDYRVAYNVAEINH
jgi:hypothetical protein